MREMLEEAANAVEGDRNVQYGPPLEDFQRTATMWSAYLGVPIQPHDVGAMMALVKVSRIRETPSKRDSWVDLAGYAACGWDCARLPAADPVLDALLDEEERIHRSTTRPPAP